MGWGRTIWNYNKRLFKIFDSNWMPILKMQFHNNDKIFNTVFPRVSCFICRCFHLKFVIIIIINVFFDYLNPFVNLYWKHLVIVTLKSITRFFPIILCLICRVPGNVLRYQVARDGAIMSYAEKIVVYYHAHFLNKECKVKLSKRIYTHHYLIKRLHRIFHGLSFSRIQTSS